MQLAVLSEDRLKPPFGWFTLGPPLQRALTDRPNAVLVSPPPLEWSELGEWVATLRRARKADTLFWIQWSSRPKLPISLIAAAGRHSKRVAYVCDPWKPSLGRIGIFATLLGLDPCFVTYREACDELKRLFPRGRFEWLPTGVDIDTFKPASGNKDIFAYWMGRRFEPIHQALLRYCADRGLRYVFTDLHTPPKFGESAQLASRARYFVVTPPDLDDSVRTGGFSPLVMRYLEGFSAGARLLGVLPRSGEYEQLQLPREGIVEIAPDGEDLARKLDEDAANGGNPAAVERACNLVRAHHSWAKRAEYIYAHLIQNGVTLLPRNGEPLTLTAPQHVEN